MALMDEENILMSKTGSKVVITVNRPGKLNAFDKPTIDKMSLLLNELGKDDSVRSIVISGAGGKAFCAGTDINYLNGLKSKQEAETFIDSVQGLGFLIESIDKVVIAAIDGYCFGLGNEIAMACDIRVATSTSLFGQPEIKIGVIPGAGGTQRLTQLIGVSKSKELIFTGESIGADEALRLGLVNYVVGKAELESKVDELIGKISANSFNSVKASKRVVNESFHPTGYKIEKQLFVECFEHPDRKEGMDAFLQKRKPNFK
jgi:enoyl-CoA hydratase